MRFRGRRRGAIVAALLMVVGAAAAWLLLTRDDGTARASITECEGAQEIDFDCYERRFTELAHSAGADAALKDLARHRKRRGFVRLACHKLTHRVGRAVGKDRGIDAFLVGYPLCSSGYYHGVVEAVMKPMGRRALARADTVCEGLRGRVRYSADHYNCAHGMGHGYMELFHSNAFRSVKGCDALTDHWEREHCYGGVFMENLSALDNVRRPPDVRPRDPLYPCNVIGAHYKTRVLRQTDHLRARYQRQRLRLGVRPLLETGARVSEGLLRRGRGQRWHPEQQTDSAAGDTRRRYCTSSASSGAIASPAITASSARSGRCCATWPTEGRGSGDFAGLTRRRAIAGRTRSAVKSSRLRTVNCRCSSTSGRSSTAI